MRTTLKLGLGITALLFLYLFITYLFFSNPNRVLDDNFRVLNVALLICSMLCIILSIIFFKDLISHMFLFNELKTLKRFLISSFIGIIFIFSLIYFTLQYTFDWIDSQYQSNFIRDKVICRSCITILNDSDYEKIEFENYRALKGIESKIWSSPSSPDTLTRKSLGWEGRFYRLRNKGTIPNKAIIIAFKEQVGNYGQYKSVFFNENVFSVYADCLYFSTITIATIGYGDIAPNNILTKFFAIFEAIIGVIITGFAFGRYFYLISKEPNFNNP